MKYYLAGKMSGIPQMNFPLFMHTAEMLRARGLDILNPAELDDDETVAAAMDNETGEHNEDGPTWGEFLGRDIELVADKVDAIIALEDWWTSRGARLEVFTALQVHKPVYTLDKGKLRRIDRNACLNYIAEGTVHDSNRFQRT